MNKFDNISLKEKMEAVGPELERLFAAMVRLDIAIQREDDAVTKQLEYRYGDLQGKNMDVLVAALKLNFTDAFLDLNGSIAQYKSVCIRYQVESEQSLKVNYFFY